MGNARPLRDNVTQSSQGKNHDGSVGNPEDMAHLLHEKQYTPDLKQSDLRLNDSSRKSLLVHPYERSVEM